MDERERLRKIEPSPAVRMAVGLWASGRVKSKKAAAEAVGIAPNYVTNLIAAKNTVLMDLIAKIDKQLEEGLDPTVLIEQLSGRAIRNIVHHMENASSEAVRLKAAQDLADRSPKTSKIQKHAVASFSIEGQDAKMLAQALVDAQDANRLFEHVTQGNFIRVSDSQSVQEQLGALNDQVEPRDG